MEGVDKFGRYGGVTIWHLKPDLKLIPGAGLAISRTFGYEDAAMNGELIILDLFFNLDAFFTETWSLNLKTGYERACDASGFVMQVGISTFIKKDR